MAGIITPGAYALTLAAAGDGRLPVFLWRNLITAYVTSEAAPGYPAAALGNPNTVEGWRATSTDAQAVTGLLDPSQPVGGVGIERHNLGSALIGVTLEGVAAGDDPDEPGDWYEIAAEQLLADDGTMMWRFAPVHLQAIRLALAAGASAPRIAVFWAGPLLTMERGVQPHTPIGFAARREVQTGRSRAGDFLGRVITDSTRRTSVQFEALTPEWVRQSEWLAFAEAAATDPVFFAWAPEDYPNEVGFCWALNDLIAETNHLVGYAGVTIELEGAV